MNLLMKLLLPLGVAGSVVYWAVMLLLFAAPIMVLGLPFLAQCAIMFVLFLPLVCLVARPILYIVAMFFLSDQPDGAVAVFWCSFVVYVVTELIPLVATLAGAASSPSKGVR